MLQFKKIVTSVSRERQNEGNECIQRVSTTMITIRILYSMVTCHERTEKKSKKISTNWKKAKI